MRYPAKRLVISEATVKTHINNLFAKAGFHSRADAVRYALRNRRASGGQAINIPGPLTKAIPKPSNPGA